MQNYAKNFSQNSLQFITPCPANEMSKFHLRELLGCEGANKTLGRHKTADPTTRDPTPMLGLSDYPCGSGSERNSFVRWKSWKLQQEPFVV